MMAEHLIYLLEKTDSPKDLIEVDVKWMECVEPMNDFLWWIENCVSHRNCITPQEAATHRTLSQHDKLLDDAELKSTFRREFSGSPHVTSYEDQVDALENMLLETRKRLQVVCTAHKELETGNPRISRNAYLSNVEKILAEEAKRLQSLIAKDYRRSFENVALSVGDLMDKLSSVASSGLLLPGAVDVNDLDRFCDLVEDLKMYISLCTEYFQEEMEKEKDQKIPQKIKGFDAANSSRLFNDSIKAEITCVHSMAKIEGITAALDYLQNDITSLELPRSALSGDYSLAVRSVCHDNMLVTMRSMQLNHATQKRQRKESLMPKMERAVGLAKRMKLIGDTVLTLVKNERLWVRTCRELLNETVEVLNDEAKYLNECMDKLTKKQTVQDLSVTNHTFLLPSLPSASFIGSSLGSRGNLSCLLSVPKNSSTMVDFTNSALSKFRSVDDQSKAVLGFSKTLYNGLFCGPSATAPTLADLISTSHRAKSEVDKMERKWSLINELQPQIYVPTPVEAAVSLNEKLCWVYLQDPEAFFAIFNNMEMDMG